MKLKGKPIGDPRADLETELIYLGLLDKAREIHRELGDQAVLSYIKSSHRLLSKVYHPDVNPLQADKAKDIQQRLNRVSQIIGDMDDAELIGVIHNGSAASGESKKKILVVDDETQLQDLFQNVLVMEGYDVRVAADGEAGYTAYHRFQPDLILTDVVMPGMSGLEMVRKIRTTVFSLKVIYMSGFFGIEGLKRDLEKETQAYGYPTLAKPFKISALLTTIEDYLVGSQTGQFHRGV